MSSFVTRLSSSAALVLAAGLLAGAQPQSSEGGRGANAPPVKIFAVDPNAPDENPPTAEGGGRTALASGRAAQSVSPLAFFYERSAGTAFSPRNSTTPYYDGGLGCSYQPAAPGGDFITPLHLPQGAVIKYLRMYFYNTAASDVTAFLTRYDGAGNYVDLASVTSGGLTSGYNSTLSLGITEVVDNLAYTYVVIWRPAVFSTSQRFCGARVAYNYPADGHFTAIAPCRVVDTRGGAPLGGGWLPAATERVYTLAGNCGIPANATGVSLNATVTQVGGAGFLSLWQTTQPYPTVSTLNFNSGETQVNAAIVPLNASGQLSVALGVNGAHVILDVNGYYY